MTTTFKTNLIAKADNKGEFDIPPELLTAYIMDRGKMTFHELMTTPSHVVDELLFYWYLLDTQSKAAERKANAKT